MFEKIILIKLKQIKKVSFFVLYEIIKLKIITKKRKFTWKMMAPAMIFNGLNLDNISNDEIYTHVCME